MLVACSQQTQSAGRPETQRNLALFRPCTASSCLRDEDVKRGAFTTAAQTAAAIRRACRPNNMSDGRRDSSWNADKRVIEKATLEWPQWVMVDLLDVCEVDGLRVEFVADAFATEFEVQTSLDKVSWDSVAHCQTRRQPIVQLSLKPPNDLLAPGVACRYVKLQLKKRCSLSAGYAIVELQVNGISSRLDIARLRPASASTTGTEMVGGAGGTRPNIKQLPPSAAVDGQPHSRWAADFHEAKNLPIAWEQWLAIDLNGVCTVEEVRIKFAERSYAAQFEVQLSDDGKYWRTVGQPERGIENVPAVIVLEGVQVCTHVRVLMTKRAHDDRGYSIQQFEVIGFEGVDERQKKATDAHSRLMKLREIPDFRKAEFLHLFRQLDGDEQGGILQEDLFDLTGERALAELDEDLSRRLDVFEFAVLLHGLTEHLPASAYDERMEALLLNAMQISHERLRGRPLQRQLTAESNAAVAAAASEELSSQPPRASTS